MKNLHKNQQGLVSIIVSSVIITIMALIVISFALIMKNEQQQALDRQLNSQAFYAAETAVNDVRKALFNGQITEDISTCDAGKAGSQQVTDTLVNSDADVSSTEIGCVTVDVAPQQLTFDSVSVNRSKILELKPIDSAGNSTKIRSLVISFDDPDGYQEFQSTAVYRPASDPYGTGAATWGNGPGMLRAELMGVPDVAATPPAATFSRDELRALNKVIFVSTVRDDANVPVSRNWNGISGAIKIPQGCDTTLAELPRVCGFRLNNIDTSLDKLYIRLMSIYKPVSVTIQGYDSLGNPVSFADAQVVVDAIGRSTDVVYRTREVIALSADYNYPDFGVVAGDLCKVLITDPSSTTTASVGAAVPACEL
ncbi:hypothetical protein KC878_00370 [Candidatus Saccharibacteria bacterium]|nr:hypothetical protein [Candidatus Saccharibacteria bacterium]MCB9821240.1 hypothetical protein [Candidatus Nomurabacteria bacterium]